VQVERASVGLGVHARLVVPCAIDGLIGEITKGRLTPDHGTSWADWRGRCGWRMRWPDGFRAGPGLGGGRDRVPGRGSVEDRPGAGDR
jgi:hypothetical protein